MPLKFDPDDFYKEMTPGQRIASRWLLHDLREQVHSPGAKIKEIRLPPEIFKVYVYLRQPYSLPGGVPPFKDYPVVSADVKDVEFVRSS